MPFSLRTRIALLVLVGLLPVLGLVLYTSFRDQQDRLDSFAHELLALARLGALGETRVAQGANQLLKVIANSPDVRSGDPASCNAFFHNMRGKHPGFSNLGVLDLDGNLACHTAGTAVAGSLRDRLYFREALATRSFVIGEYIVGRATSRASITYALPVEDANGRVKGVAFAALDLEKLALDAEVELPPGVHLTVVDRNGTIIGADQTHRARIGIPYGHAALDAARKSLPREVVVARDPGGIERMYAFAGVGGESPPSLLVVASMAREDLLAPALERLGLQLALLALLALAGTWAARWMGRRTIVAPVRSLLQRVNAIAGREAGSTDGAPGDWDEIDQLSKAFDTMAGILAARAADRDATEAELHKSRKRWLAAQRIGNIGNWELDLATNQFWWSDQVFQIFELRPGEFTGTYESFAERVFPQDAERVEAARRSAFHGGRLDIEHRIVTGRGRVRWIQVTGGSKAGETGTPTLLTGTLQDTTERLRNKRLLAWESRVLESISSGGPLQGILDDIARGLEDLIAGAIASIHLVDADGIHLLHGTAPGLPESYSRVLHGLASGPLVGSCGTAVPRRETVIVSDIETDPLWADYRDLAREHGLRACWSIPVLDSRHRAIATFAVYNREPLTPQPEDLQLAERMASLVGIVLERDERARLQQEAETQLKRNQDFLAMATRVARMGAWQVEVPTMQTTWSTDLQAIYEAPPGYVITVEGSLAFYTPESQVELRKLYGECLAHGVPFDTELDVITGSGRPISVRVMGEAVRDAAGHIVRVQGAVQDVSAQKAAEMRERKLAERLATTLESIGDGFVTFDADWRFQFVNREAGRILQREPADLVGRVMWNEFPDGLGTTFHRQYDIALAEQRSVHLTEFYPPLALWLELSVYPTSDGLAVNFRDVTATYATESQLRLLQAAIARQNDIVVITEAEPIDEPGPRIVFVNDAFERRTGYSREEVIGRSPRFLQGARTLRPELDRIRKAMEQWQPVRAELVNYTKAGEEFWLEIDIAPIADATGWFTHWVAVERDVTERKVAEEEILRLNAILEDRVRQRTELLSAANQELEAFSYTISHDLRAPVRALDGFSEVLLADFGDSLPPEAQHYLKSIRRSARRMGLLIDDLLAFARLGRLELSRQPIDHGSLVREVVAELASTYPGRESQVHVGPLPASLGDLALVRQVWANLLSNALKFSSNVADPRIEVGCETLAGELAYFVRDNGAGFDPRYAGRLFDVFQRLHAETEFEGTGVGLAIVKRIIERHGGRVWAKGELGRGAVIHFTVPGPSIA